MTENSLDHRRRGRVPVSLSITVSLEGQEIAVESRNLSLKGLACNPNPALCENFPCQVIISLAPDVRAVIKGKVVRAGESEAAIDFLSMDMDSFAHLRKIVEYHSQNPAAVSRELLTPAFPISRPPTLFLKRKPKK
jgi:hypothetical protein